MESPEFKLQINFAKVQLQRSSLDEILQQLKETAAKDGATVYQGTVYLAGQDSAGKYWVQYNLVNDGKGCWSDWPEWAYSLALEALLNKKQLFVWANGEPLGDNILKVCVMNIAPP